MFTLTASKIAFRELRAAPAKFIFVIAAVTVGVAALSGIKGFGTSFKSTLLRNAKQLIAADVQSQTWNDPLPEQIAAMQKLGDRVGWLTRATEIVSMGGSDRQKVPQLVSVKAIDPAVYPFYGKLSLSPDVPLRQLLCDDSSVIVTQELLIRMKVRTGDSIRLGGKSFRIAGILRGEPDRLASGFGPGMRVLMTRQGLARTGLISYGSRAAQRFLFKLKPGIDLDQLKAQIKNILPRVFISDYREGSPVVGAAIDNTTVFLSLISLIALIVGALGVGMSIHSHVQQRLDTIGIIKAIGGRSTQLLQIYLIQTLCLGVTGSVLGILAGMAVQRSFPLLMQQVFSQLPSVTFDWSFAVEGLCLGILATLLFTLPALLEVRNIRPNLIFRREMAETSLEGRARWLRLAMSAVSALFILAGFLGIAARVSGSWKMGLYFAEGLAAGIVVLSGIAAILLVALRQLVRLSQHTLPAALRHGIANLYRPGNHARSVLVALGVGVMFTLTTYLLQRTVLREIISEAPENQGNLFLLDIRDSTGVADLVNGQPGVSGKLELVGYLVARMLSRNNVPVGDLGLTKQRKDQASAVRITTANGLPPSLHVKRGQWWQNDTSAPLLAVSEESSRNFKLKLGDRVRFQAAGRTLDAPIVAIFEREARATVRHDLVFPRNALTGLPVVFYGTIHADPSRIPDIEEVLFEKFPTVTVMNLADILKRIQEAVDQVALVIRFLAFFAILAGVIILSSSIAGTRYRRIREIAILKALGATRQRIRVIFSLEFSVLGAVAGVIGGLLANVFTKVIARKFIETSFDFDFASVLLAMIITAVLANIAGWAASARILDQKPLEVLRSE
jgi:putative ABC transport system permease protein